MMLVFRLMMTAMIVLRSISGQSDRLRYMTCGFGRLGRVHWEVVELLPWFAPSL